VVDPVVDTGSGGTLLRRINGTALIIAALVATVGALAFPVWSYADRSGTGQANLNASAVSTQWGPLTAADRDFLVKVRLAGLWELPAGQQAIERAPSQAVKDCGDHLVVGHTDLDQRARDVAAKLGVELPNQPNAQQQGWLKELTAASGQDYERTFANLLRDSHGKVFVLIAQIRNSTRNTLIRQLASDANQTVLDHITMLEATGLVDFDSIANEAAGDATASPTGPPPPDGNLPPAPSPVRPSGDTSFTSRPSTGPGAPTAVNTDRPDPGAQPSMPMDMPMP
jgi:predicted outer membrane protein